MLKFDVAELKAALAASPFVTSVIEVGSDRLAEAWANKRCVRYAFQLDVMINEGTTRVYFGVKGNFPLSLPIVYLVKWDEFGVLPHVEADGFICYAHEVDSVLNINDVGGIAQEAVKRAVSVLVEGISGRNNMDFIDEYGAYWDRQKSLKHIVSLVSPTDQVKQIFLYKGKTIDYLADDDESFKKFVNVNSKAKVKRQSATYVPLKAGAQMPPPPISPFWSHDQVRQLILDNLDDARRGELAETSVEKRLDDVVLVKLDKSSDGETLFAMRFKGIRNSHPLAPSSTVREIVPLAVNRKDREYLLPRGGSNLCLQDKKVLLIGCGSIGGYIAHELTRSGVTNLTLIDHDILAAENIFRHVLGMKDVGKPKVYALKADIEARLPYMNITPINHILERVVTEGKLNFTGYDLIISATGNVTLELAFNDHLSKLPTPPVIYTWNEPYGIGGHSLITKVNAESKGCLSCLYVYDDEDLVCRASFAEKGQIFKKNIDGCRGVFMPFGALDSIKSAEITVRLAVEVLQGKIQRNLIRSWRGDATEFLNAGKRLSSRYHKTSDHFIEDSEFYYGECPVCNRA